MFKLWTVWALLAALPAEREFTFESPRGQTHRAILTVPAEPNGVSVLLIGGGTAWDEHWTVPASYTVDGQTTRVTIDGQPTRDADTIASALAARGFVVMRWSAVHTGDERAKENAALATGLPFPYSVELTRTALGVMRAQPGVDGARVALVGASLGAARACQVADDGVMAMAFLSGAYLSRTAKPSRDLAAQVWAEYAGADADASGAIDSAELAAYRAPAGVAPLPDFPGADRDRDGALRPWELASSVWLARVDAGDTSLSPSKPMLGAGPWPSDVLEKGSAPVLVLYGGLDSMSFHGPWVERLAAKKPGVTVVYFPGLGHQLAPETDGLCGAIAPEVVDRLAEWLTREAVPR